MGYSYSAAAGDKMDGIEDACKQTRPPEVTSSNVFFANGKSYFYEITRKTQKDAGIAGSIALRWTGEDGKEWCRKIGTFRIDGNGNCVRGPKLFKNAKPRVRKSYVPAW